MSSPSVEMGIRLDKSKCISCILPGSTASQDHTLAVGDRILSVSMLYAQADVFRCCVGNACDGNRNEDTTMMMMLKMVMRM